MQEVNACRRTFPNHYVKVNAFDATRGVESVRLSFIVNRPAEEPGFGLIREEAAGRHMRYTLRAMRRSGRRATSVNAASDATVTLEEGD